MNTFSFFPRRTMIMALFVLTVVSRDCSPIVHLAPAAEPDRASAPTVAVIGEPSPTPPELPPTLTPASPASPTPTIVGEPTAVPTCEAVLPGGDWNSIADLPRQINTLVADPSNAQILYAGTGDYAGSGGGVYKSDDGGLTWRAMSKGLPNASVLALACSYGQTRALFAAVSVGNDAFVSLDGAATWTRLGALGSPGGFEHRLYTAPNAGNTIFSQSLPGELSRSTDGGHTWVPIGEGLPGDEHEVYVLSLALDPTNAQIIYAGTGGFVGQGNGVYKSVDGGQTWSPANRGMLDYRITAVAVDPAQPQNVYAGTDSGEMFKTTDGGQTWNDLSSRVNRSEPGAEIRSILINPDKPQTVYVLRNMSGLIVSDDGGEQWQPVGMPADLSQPSFTTMLVIFDPQPIVIVGIEHEGGWRYSPN